MYEALVCFSFPPFVLGHLCNVIIDSLVKFALTFGQVFILANYKLKTCMCLMQVYSVYIVLENTETIALFMISVTVVTMKYRYIGL